jgi:hypothetical protein
MVQEANEQPPHERASMEESNQAPESDGNQHEHEMIEPDTIVRLTPQGQLYWENLLKTLSEAAGRPITGDDLGEIMKRVRADTGQADPQFTDPAVMQSFLKHLRGPSSQ